MGDICSIVFHASPLNGFTISCECTWHFLKEGQKMFKVRDCKPTFRGWSKVCSPYELQSASPIYFLNICYQLANLDLQEDTVGGCFEIGGAKSLVIFDQCRSSQEGTGLN